MGSCFSNEKKKLQQRSKTIYTMCEENNLLNKSIKSEETSKQCSPEKKFSKKKFPNKKCSSKKCSSKKSPCVKQSPLALLSSPSQIKTDEMTEVYDVPSKDFKNKKEVLLNYGIVLLNEIGHGAYARVYLGENIYDKSKIACKIIALKNDRDRDKTMVGTKNELFVLEKTRHPHIIRLYFHFIINNEIYIIMEHASHGTLTRFVRDKGPLPERYCKTPFAQIVSGVRHMHRKGIAHRDLKCDNILIDENFNFLITDFGLSTVVFRPSKGGIQLARNYCGTEPYMAPEIVKHNRQYDAFSTEHNKQYDPFLTKHNKQYDPLPTDVWALGVILFAMLNRGHPFDTSDKSQMLENQLKEKWRFSKKVAPPTFQLLHCIKQMLTPDPNKRITLEQLCHHSWLRDCVSEIVE